MSNEENPQPTDDNVTVGHLLEDPDLCRQFLCDTLLHAYVAYGPDYIDEILYLVDEQAKQYHTNQQ